MHHDRKTVVKFDKQAYFRALSKLNLCLYVTVEVFDSLPMDGALRYQEYSTWLFTEYKSVRLKKDYLLIEFQLKQYLRAIYTKGEKRSNFLA